MELLRGTNQKITLTQSGYPPEKLTDNCWLLYELDELEIIVSNQPVDSHINEWLLRPTDDNQFILEIPNLTEITNKNYILYLNIQGIYYSVDFRIINAFKSVRNGPLTADFNPSVPKPRLGTVGFTSVEVLRPLSWPETFTQLFLQLYKNGQWNTVGNMYYDSDDEMIRLTSLEKCTTFKLRWAVKYNNVGSI